MGVTAGALAGVEWDESGMGMAGSVPARGTICNLNDAGCRPQPCGMRHTGESALAGGRKETTMSAELSAP
ncbi:MAG: hypothetical protein ABIR56_05970, partial [Polaromonas sp.]